MQNAYLNAYFFCLFNFYFRKVLNRTYYGMLLSFQMETREDINSAEIFWRKKPNLVQLQKNTTMQHLKNCSQLMQFWHLRVMHGHGYWMSVVCLVTHLNSDIRINLLTVDIVNAYCASAFVSAIPSYHLLCSSVSIYSPPKTKCSNLSIITCIYNINFYQYTINLFRK